MSEPQTIGPAETPGLPKDTVDPDIKTLVFPRTTTAFAVIEMLKPAEVITLPAGDRNLQPVASVIFVVPATVTVSTPETIVLVSVPTAIVLVFVAGPI
jgi:hypothetical protein